MTRFVTSPADPRKLSMLSHQIARQHPGRRHHVHGPIQPMDRQRDPLWWRVMSVAIMAACTVYALSLWIVK